MIIDLRTCENCESYNYQKVDQCCVVCENQENWKPKTKEKIEYGDV